MANVLMTYEELFSFKMELEKIRKDAPAFFKYFERRIKNIMKQTEVVRKIIGKNLGEIQRRYIQLDEHGKPKHADAEKTRWLFHPSITTAGGILLTGNQVQQAYEQEAWNFLSTSVTVKI